MKFSVSGNLEIQILEQTKPRIIFSITTLNRITTKDLSMLVLPIDQKVLASIQPVDAAGNPAKIDGQPAWTSSSESIAIVVPNPDDASGVWTAWVQPAGALGSCQVNVTADADIGSGVTSIAGVLDISTVAGEAVGFKIETATPVPKK